MDPHCPGSPQPRHEALDARGREYVARRLRIVRGDWPAGRTGLAPDDDGIARSGLWLDTSKPHREDAADFVGRFYYNQKPALLRWALTKPLDRVTYSPLAPRKADFDMVRDLMIETGVLNKKIEFSDYTDTRFSDQASTQTPWRYEPGTAIAR